VKILTTGKVLGLDVGDKRIGVAVCDPLRLAARPLRTVVRGGRDRDNWDEFARIVRAEEIVEVVCGLPLHMNGSEGEQAKRTRKWAKRFVNAMAEATATSLPLHFQDERLSSFSADEILAATGSKASQDAAAAAVILQSWLDDQRREHSLDDE
jgi:putative Holliday junction resolvase